eukprot:6205925-Pleurochrysis_carterae.AAC.1
MEYQKKLGDDPLGSSSSFLWSFRVLSSKRLQLRHPAPPLVKGRISADHSPAGFHLSAWRGAARHTTASERAWRRVCARAGGSLHDAGRRRAVE